MSTRGNGLTLQQITKRLNEGEGDTASLWRLVTAMSEELQRLQQKIKHMRGQGDDLDMTGNFLGGISSALRQKNKNYKIIYGVVKYSIPVLGYYCVSTLREPHEYIICHDRTCFLSGIATKQAATYAYGSLVCVLLQGSTTSEGTIICDVGHQANKQLCNYPPRQLSSGLSSGYKLDPLSEQLCSIKAKQTGITENTLYGQPYDLTSTGDFTQYTSLGGYIHLDPMMFLAKLNDACGLWMFYTDQLTRLAGPNLSVDSSIHEETYANDEGECVGYRGVSTYPYQNLGFKTFEAYVNYNNKTSRWYNYENSSDNDKSFFKKSTTAERRFEDKGFTEAQDGPYIKQWYNVEEYEGYLGQGNIYQIIAPLTGARATQLLFNDITNPPNKETIIPDDRDSNLFSFGDYNELFYLDDSGQLQIKDEFIKSSSEALYSNNFFSLILKPKNKFTEQLNNFLYGLVKYKPYAQLNSTQRGDFFGLLREHRGVDGSYTLESAREIHLIKQVKIPVPEKRVEPDDPAGDSRANANYDYSGFNGTHRVTNLTIPDPKDEIANLVKDIPEESLDDVNYRLNTGMLIKGYQEIQTKCNSDPAYRKQYERLSKDEKEQEAYSAANEWVQKQESYNSVVSALNLSDILAYDTEWKQLHPFKYHKQDYKIKDSGAFDCNQHRLDTGYLKDAQFLPQPPKQTLDIDHKYKEQEYFESSASFNILNDGSVIIRDGYGGEIRMSGGSIDISCPGDINLFPGRRLVSWSGDDTIIKAHNSIDLTAAENDVRVKAECNIEMVSGMSTTGGHTLIENRASGKESIQNYKKMSNAGNAGEDLICDGIIFKTTDSPVLTYANTVFTEASDGGITFYTTAHDGEELDANGNPTVENPGSITLATGYINVYAQSTTMSVQDAPVTGINDYNEFYNRFPRHNSFTDNDASKLLRFTYRTDKQYGTDESYIIPAPYWHSLILTPKEKAKAKKNHIELTDLEYMYDVGTWSESCDSFKNDENIEILTGAPFPGYKYLNKKSTEKIVWRPDYILFDHITGVNSQDTNLYETTNTFNSVERFTVKNGFFINSRNSKGESKWQI